MQQLISINLELDRLSNHEFDQFLTNLFNSCDKREFITKAISHLIINEIIQQKETRYYDLMSKQIKNIIEQRKLVNNKQQQQQINQCIDQIKININLLSEDIISRLVTYLDWQSIQYMQVINKHFYIAIVNRVNSFATISLSSRKIKSYFNNFGNHFVSFKINNFIRFQAINSLEIDLHHLLELFNLYKKKGFWIWTNLKHLVVDFFLFPKVKETFLNHYKRSLGDGTHERLMLHSYLENYKLNISKLNIESLTWKRIGFSPAFYLDSEFDAINEASFCIINPNVESLTIEHVAKWENNSYTSKVMMSIKSCYDLKKLCLWKITQNLFDALMLTIGHQIEEFQTDLEYFVEQSAHKAIIEPHNDINLHKLVKLTYELNYQNDWMYKIIEKANNLQTIVITGNEPNHAKHLLSKLFTNILIKDHKISEIYANMHFDLVINEMQKIIYNQYGNQYIFHNIKFHFDSQWIKFNDIQTMLKLLKVCVKGDFVLSIFFWTEKCKKDVIIILEKCKCMDILYKLFGEGVVIYNLNNGLSDNDLMPPVHWHDIYPYKWHHHFDDEFYKIFM